MPERKGRWRVPDTRLSRAPLAPGSAFPPFAAVSSSINKSVNHKNLGPVVLCSGGGAWGEGHRSLGLLAGRAQPREPSQGGCGRLWRRREAGRSSERKWHQLRTPFVRAVSPHVPCAPAQQTRMESGDTHHHGHSPSQDEDEDGLMAETQGPGLRREGPGSLQCGLKVGVTVPACTLGYVW